MMATSHAFPPEESFPHPTPTNFQSQQNTKQAVIYNKSGTKCMNIVKEPGMSLSPTSPSTREQNDSSPSHNLQNNNGTAKKKKKRKSKRKPPADHVEEPDIQANGSHNNHIKAHQVNYNSDDGEDVVDVELEDEDDYDSEDGYDPEDPEIPFPRKDSIANLDGDNHHVTNTASKKKKKKKKNKNGLNINQISDIHHNHPHHNHSHKSRKDGIWNTNNNEERQRIREFWLQLGEEERRSLVKVEKEAVLKKMKEQQKHSCSCSVCGKKRTAIEEELETLYDAYYEELESYANQQQQFGPSNIEYRNDSAEYDDEDDDEEYDEDDEDDDEDYEGSENGSDTRREIFNFGNSLTVKGGILTVADDLLKNDGKKFLEMMERLAERRMQREDEAAMEQRDYEEYDDDDDEEYEDDAEEDNQTDEQRMEEGRRMFQIFAARMFEQRVLNAYREKVAQERQQKLLEELEEENRLKEERELKKLKEKEKKKAKNRALKLQKEEERARKEAERLAEEKALRAERDRKLEEERKKREEERLKKEADRRAREEERQRKEEEKRRKAKEDKEREERRKKEQEAKERKEREREEKERKEREEKFRKEKEERRQREERERKQRELKEKERKEKEEQERKDREKKEREAKERERKEKEEQERKDREEKDRKEREEKQRAASVPPVRQQHHERKRTITPIGQPSAQTPPPPTISTTVVHNKSSSMPNGINWMNYSSHEHHPPLPPQHPINPQHVINSHLPPHPPPPTPHPLFSPGGPQSQFGGQPVGIMNGPTGMTNEVVNDVFTNNKKVINPPPQGTNTLQGINPTSSLFASGLGPIGMNVHPHHGGPPVPMHAHHQVMRQQIPPPRGFNPIAPTPHLAGPSGVPPSVASTNLSLLNENTVMSGSGNIGTGVSGNPQTGAFGGLPIGGGQGSLGPQTFNLGTQVVSQPPVSHMVSNVPQSTPLAPIGHRRMSQHPEDSHVKTIHRPQPIQRPRRNSGTGQSLDAHTNTRSPPPGFGNMVGSNALLGEDQPHPMVNRRQSLALVESSYFSNSLFSTAMPGESNPPQSSPNQQQQQHGTTRLSHRSVPSENEWPPIRGRQNVTDNHVGESLPMNGGNNNVGSNNIGTNDIWGSNYVGGQSLWYSEGNNPANRRAVGSRDFSIP